ncbi:hypothetical protein Hrubri_1703 [Herbaspirillum rubrisubalbicans M1]|uniref:hypothetical protein n=1 Tax=Herbaspirillum rubrisubalbicans TaxID=80842 RepID=UPI00073AD3F8|nr:hypothetical protein [Herbaspirillum rubrisubalbicans]ALU88908.1 hypothetical protein Hrubri_1703 [Herbaspirillum rubrisubalbicans M1]
MTTKGVILEQAERSTTRIAPHGGGANAAVKAETAAEKTFWQKSSPWVHGVLGVASFVPGLSVITGAIDAAIYTAEGDYTEAGIAAASMIPGGKVVTTVGKVAKRAVGMTKGVGAAKRGAKGARETEEALKAARAAKEAEETAKFAKEVNAAKAAREAKQAKEAAQAGAGGKGGGKDTTVKKRPKGPCDHLRQGSGKGPYRGGAHGKTSKPAKDGKDSHHMPADNVSPLKSNEGPAIQMDPLDHKNTSSYGYLKKAAFYRKTVGNLIKNKQWRKALAIEIRDVRKIAKKVGDQRKYNEAMLEMLEYFKCLEKHGLLP